MITTYKTKLANKLRLTESVYLFHFSLLNPQIINFFAGQYLILLVPSAGAGIKRLYSIASSPTTTDSFDLIIEVVEGGVASNYLKNLEIGAEINFQGPAGAFTLKDNSNNKIFLATGTGIAPVRSMIKKLQITNSKSQIFLYWGLKYFKEVYLLDELKNYGLRIADFNFKICLSRENSLEMINLEDRKYFSMGHVDNVCFNETSSLKFKISNYDYYLCGSPQIVDSLRNCLSQKGISEENVFFEKF